MAEKKCCGNCHYSKINNIGIRCAICMLKSNISEDRLELHGRDDRCEEWLARTDEYISRDVFENPEYYIDSAYKDGDTE